MNRIIIHIKRYIFRGLLAIIPLALSLLAIMFLYNAIDRRVVVVFKNLFGYSFPGLGILILLITFYLLGLLASNILGRQIFKFIENITERIPLIGATYRVGKKLGETLSLPEKQVFKKVVLVNYLIPGTWTVGFVTGSVIDKNNNDEILLKVFVPTPPNPTSGTMVFVKESETKDPGWTVEEALNTILSGGIIGPAELK